VGGLTTTWGSIWRPQKLGGGVQYQVVTSHGDTSGGNHKMSVVTHTPLNCNSTHLVIFAALALRGLHQRLRLGGSWGQARRGSVYIAYYRESQSSTISHIAKCVNLFSRVSLRALCKLLNLICVGYEKEVLCAGEKCAAMGTEQCAAMGL